MLPSLGGAATAPLPPQRFATGSALYAMTRQIGVAHGVACLVAILGTATGPGAVGAAFHHAWAFMTACSLLAGVILLGVGARATETADARPLVEEATTPDTGNGDTTPTGRSDRVQRPGVDELRRGRTVSRRASATRSWSRADEARARRRRLAQSSVERRRRGSQRPRTRHRPRPDRALARRARPR